MAHSEIVGVVRRESLGDRTSHEGALPTLALRPGGSVLIIGGGAQSIGLYAAGLAVAHGAEVVDYFDDRAERLAVAEQFGARVHQLDKNRLSVLGSPRAGSRSTGQDHWPVRHRSRGLLEPGRNQRCPGALKPGGICTAVGYYLPRCVPIPLMHMYVNDATLRLGVSHVRPTLPDLLDVIARTGFPAEKVTSLLADWDDAPHAYQARTTKVVLHRAPLSL